jgi:integrase
MAYKKRVDSKGLILRIGESQRSDGRYMYRYTDMCGKRHAIYDHDLHKLREKEKEELRQLNAGVDYSAGKITVLELVERSLILQQGLRETTKNGNAYRVKTLKSYALAQMRINKVKMSDVKNWVLEMWRAGLAYGTIKHIVSIVRCAFRMACQEDIVLKNPADFKLSELIANNEKKRMALTEAQQKAWLDFLRDDKHFSKYYDENVVLLETGLRISEFCGLTLKDLDFENRKIRVDHQLQRTAHGKYYVDKPKTADSVRFIPMTDNAYAALKNIIANRPKLKIEPIIDGYSGFLLICKNGSPKTAINVQDSMRNALKKYNANNAVKLPTITPHVLRHTFCTNMANAGMNIKNLQYLMGHSTVNMTLNVYAHASYDNAAMEMGEIVALRKTQESIKAQ